jgi:hypothetical protein
VPRYIYEGTRDMARQIAKSQEGQASLRTSRYILLIGAASKKWLSGMARQPDSTKKAHGFEKIVRHFLTMLLEQVDHAA